MRFEGKNNDTGESWIVRIRKGDEQAFEAMFKKYYEPLTRFSWRYVKSKAIAEEVVQGVFSRLWSDRQDLQATGSLRSYLYKAVKHRSLDHLKHKKVQRKYNHQCDDRPSVAYLDYEDPRRKKQIQEAIANAIEDLPPRGKMTYKLHRYDGLTYEEIADVMDVSVSTVESQMTRTLKTLRERLAYLLPLLILAITA